jgi:signal transduction histidine kinase
MSPRAARLVIRGLVGLAIVMMATSIALAITTLDRQRPGQVVIVPAERADEFRAVASALDPDGDCEGAIEADPFLGDGPRVMCELEAHRAEGTTFTAGWGDLATGFVLGLVWLGTGALIVSRQPRNTAGWIFTAIGLFFVFEVFSLGLVVKGAKVDPGSVPLLGLWAVIAEYALLPFALISLLFLLYPDGRPPTARWRWAPRVLFLGVGIAIVSFALDPGPLNNLVDSGVVYLNPLGVPALEGTAGALTAVGTLLALAASLSTIVAVRGRFKRSSGEERQQMRWLVFVATAAGVAFLVLGVGGSLADTFIQGAEDVRVLGIDPFDLLWVIFALVLVVGIPAAYLIAIFKHGLWDLDVVIKKAAVAIVLTLLMVGIGLVLLGIASQFVVADENPFVVLLGGFALGVLSIPLVRLSRRIATRIAYGKRSTPYDVLTAFGERVESTYSTEDVLPRMAQLLVEGTGAGSARVLVRVGSDLIEEARWPAEVSKQADEYVVPVLDRGEVLGSLAVSMPASDPINPSKERLIRDLASQVGLVLRNVKLIAELRASRQRLVAAQDEERRKIERNLHDGAQQQLVALTVQLKLARSLVERDPAKAGELLGTIQGSATDALEDLRDLARGIYPPLLADQGLPAALEAQARKAVVPTTVEAQAVGRYAQEVEAAVYFCTLEALNNVAKYAEARRATVRLSQQNGRLAFSINDDGRGFDPNAVAGGTGLQGMADRLEAIGGALEVDSASGSGTTVRGWIPMEGSRR